jgi:hypothetical protein
VLKLLTKIGDKAARGYLYITDLLTPELCFLRVVLGHFIVTVATAVIIKTSELILGLIDIHSIVFDFADYGLAMFFLIAVLWEGINRCLLSRKYR